MSQMHLGICSLFIILFYFLRKSTSQINYVKNSLLEYSQVKVLKVIDFSLYSFWVPF